MTELHDPQNFASQLRQILSAGRLPLAFFIGAGCPTSIRVQDESGNANPLIPDIKGLTAKVSASLSASKFAEEFGVLQGTFAEDEVDNPTVEDVLNRIRALHDVAGSVGVRGLSADNLRSLDREVCSVIRDIVGPKLPAGDTPYHHLADFIRLRRQRAPEIFTSNYDLLCEAALEDRRAPYFDGFVGALRPFFDQQAIEEDECSSRWSRLWKLHGSINWRIEPSSSRVFRSMNVDDGDELLIHPSRLKYDESRRMPYVVMIDRLRGFLRQQGPAALLVCGYSFGDEHLNAAIVDGLQANPSAVCFGLQYGSLSSYPAGTELAKKNSGLALFAEDGAVFRGAEGRWAADPAAEEGSLGGVFEVKTATAPEASADGSPEPEESAQATIDVRMLLGDFAKLGAFLRQFIELSKGLPDEA